MSRANRRTVQRRDNPLLTVEEREEALTRKAASPRIITRAKHGSAIHDRREDRLKA